jgi:hypothetical protein
MELVVVAYGKLKKSNSINEDSLEYKLIGIIIEFQSKYHRVL